MADLNIRIIEINVTETGSGRSFEVIDLKKALTAEERPEQTPTSLLLNDEKS